MFVFSIVRKRAKQTVPTVPCNIQSPPQYQLHLHYLFQLFHSQTRGQLTHSLAELGHGARLSQLLCILVLVWCIVLYFVFDSNIFQQKLKYTRWSTVVPAVMGTVSRKQLVNVNLSPQVTLRENWNTSQNPRGENL